MWKKKVVKNFTQGSIKGYPTEHSKLVVFLHLKCKPPSPLSKLIKLASIVSIGEGLKFYDVSTAGLSWR